MTEDHKRKVSEGNKKYCQNNKDRMRSQIELMHQSNQTPEAKKKRTDSRWSKTENHKKQSLSLQKRYTDYPELKNQISDKMVAWHEDPDNKEKYKESHGENWRDKISESISQKYIDGGFAWSKGRYFSTKMKKEFYYRSSWELRYMKELDQDVLVVGWNYEPFWIKYIKEESQHRYVPDFLIEYADRSEIHEVGVRALKDTQVDKIQAIKEFCDKKQWIFKIVDESHFI